MPIDKSTVDPMLNPFRNMVADVDGRGLKGKDLDAMKAMMQTMERLAVEMDDVISYTTKLTTDNIFLNFSNAYSRALSAAASSNQPTDDTGLMQQTLKQYESSYNQLKDNPEHAHLIGPIKKVLDIGHSGDSYPVFLRMCEEQGIFEAMKNGEQRPVIEFDLHVARVMGDPVRFEMSTKILAGYEALCKQNPFGLADNVEFEILRQRLEWQYAPLIAKWKAIIERWGKMHEMVFDWIDSFCSFAPIDGRWSDPRGEKYTRENIQRTQECNPGQLKVRESIFKEYFNLTWDDVWTHKTYLAEQKASRIWDSDERIELLKKTYPVCKPGSKPPSDVLSANEQIFRSKTYRSARHIARFGDGVTKAPGYDFAQFSDFVKKFMKEKKQAQ